MSGQPQATWAQLLRRLLPLVPLSEKRRFFGLFILSISLSLCELALVGAVALLAATFNSDAAVLGSKPMLFLRHQCGIPLPNEPRFLALALLAAALFAIACKNTLDIALRCWQTRFSESVGAAVRSLIFRFYQRTPYLWIQGKGVADLNFSLNAATYLALFLNSVLQMTTSSLTLLILFAGLLKVALLPTFMLLGIFGIGGFLVVKASRAVQERAAGRTYQADYRLNRIFHLALHGLKDVRLYCRENALFSSCATHLAEMVRAKTWTAAVGRLPSAALEVLAPGTLLVLMLFLVCIRDASMVYISGVMGFMAMASWRSLAAVSQVMYSVTFSRSLLPYLRHIADMVELEASMRSELLDLDSAPAPLSFTRDIELAGVSFHYPESQAGVDQVTITIRKGEMLGLVGLSGAGKSTLVNLLTGLIPPDSGELRVDGLVVNKDNMRAWLEHIGYVSQSPYILDASLAENVALSHFGEDIDRGRVLECCRMAALDFLDELEQGMDTILGDRGVRLSGGQAQRVAIARALFNSPDLIIFDEATSALDLKNEKAIHETILSLKDKVTLVIVAHRLSTVEGCDAIVWLDGGRVRMSGTPGEVLSEYREALRTHAPASPTAETDES